MATHRTAFGSVVTFPDGIDLEEFSASPLTGNFGVRGAVRDDGLAALFDDAGFERDEAIQFSLAAGAAPLAVEPVKMEVPVEPGKHAVVLVERGGALSWRYPDEDPGDALDVRSLRNLHFRIDPSPGSGEDDSGIQDTRGWIHDIIADWLGHTIRVYVLRFAARGAVEYLAPLLERDVTEGIVHVSGWDPSVWLPAAAPPPEGRPRKILLLVHGTFSSTRGSFGALAGEPGTGRGILAAALAKYDRVIGFDHRTLTENPLQNAEKLAQALLSLNLAEDAEFDAIAFSRGGLVLRYLTERVLPQRKFPLTARRLVFVGCTNGGTNLAEPQNWRRMLDLYTNLVLAGTHAAGWIPGFGTGAAIVSETIKSISAFVQGIATSAIDESHVPGIAAMKPEGEFVRALNDAPVDAEAPFTTRYYWTGASFEIREGPGAGFADGVRDYLLYHVADRLFKDANDLVVDCAMMRAFGRHDVLVDKASEALHSEERIYHTNYFTSSELCGLLGEWLMNTPDVFAHMRTDMQVIDGDWKVSEVMGTLGEDPLAPVVVIERQLARVRFRLMSTSELGSQLIASTALDMTVTQAVSEDDPIRTLTESEEDQVLFGDSLFQLGDRAYRSIDRGNEEGARKVVLINGTVVGVVLNEAWALQSRAQQEAAIEVRGGDFGGIGGGVPGGAIGPELSPAVMENPSVTPESQRDEASGPEVAGASPGTFECQFEAEMPSRPRALTPATVVVRISRELHAIDADATHRAETASVAEAGVIDIMVKPIHNCAIDGADAARVEPPAAGSPQTVSFNVVGLAEGEAELRVVAAQGARTLVTIALNPRFVAEPERLVVQAKASLDDDEGALIDLRIRDVSEGSESDVRLLYDLSCDDLTLMVEEDSIKLNGQRRLDFIASIYADIEGYWRKAALESRRAPERVKAIMFDFSDELRRKGMLLCEQLIPERVRQTLWDAHAAKRLGAIRVLTREPSIPWEMLFLRDPTKNVPASQGCFLADLGLVRWNSALGYPPARITIESDRAFYLIPDYPPPYTLQSTAEDRALLQTLFRASGLQATKQRMSALFDSERFDLFHAGCHGEAKRGRPWESGLLIEVEGPTGSPDFLRPYYLQGIANGGRPLVFLNACQVGMTDEGMTGAAGLGQAFLETCKAGILVAPMWSVRDRTASLFARSFYERLVAGATLASAVRYARSVAKQAGDPTWLAYSVWGHPFARIELKHTASLEAGRPAI